MNGSGWINVVGNWPGSGVWLGIRGFGVWSWEKVSTPAYFIAVGDVNGDWMDDVIGVWSSGLWVKYSSLGTWEKIATNLPNDIDAGFFRTGTWEAGASEYLKPVCGYLEPMGGYAEWPGSGDYTDFSEEGPGGSNFVFKEEKNLNPQESAAHRINRSPGPGEPGFTYIEQLNLVPKETVDKKDNERLMP
jgi:hypothetical protein